MKEGCFPWKKYACGISLLFLYASFGFIQHLLLHVIPGRSTALEQLGARLPAFTVIFLAISFFIKRFFFLLSLFVYVPSFSLLTYFTATTKDRNVALIINTSLSLFFIIFAMAAHFSFRIPLYRVNQLVLEEPPSFVNILFKAPPLSFADFDERSKKQQALTLVIAASKNIYEKGENIVIGYTLWNKSREKQLINDIIVPGGNLSCWVFSRNDFTNVRKPQTQYTQPSWIDPGEENMVWLKPSESTTGELVFDSSELNEGLYEVRAMLTMHGVLKEKLLQLELLSDTVTIQIEEL